MTDPRNISIDDFTYELPEEKIALHPLIKRDASKLLVYNNGSITESLYSNIDEYLPAGSLLVFNNTKVINARLRFKKSTGAVIEIFCLEPCDVLNEYSSIMNKKETVRWKCLVGGAAKWKNEVLEKNILIDHEPVIVKATLIEKRTDTYIIEFSWIPGNISFADILATAGDIPLPPYIKRHTAKEDLERYQTIYARHEGSVAAPTAGLHFTEELFKKLVIKNIYKEYVTLHVGAGTFKPVKSVTMEHHEMHSEWIDVSSEAIKNIRSKLNNVIAIGTTSLRTIETIYWLGVKIFLDPAIKKPELKQWEIYEKPLSSVNLSAADALNALLSWMDKQHMDRLFTQTQLLIVPGYTFKIVKALVTNFHQPRSTLLLLVAAAVGKNWKAIYQHALEHDYRFLSYGDGNLIFIATNP